MKSSIFLFLGFCNITLSHNRPDPARDWDWENPSSINLYQYVRNNPINLFDPNGFAAWEITQNWNEEHVKAFQTYAANRAEEYRKGGGTFKNCTCEDFAINVVVDYASQNGLPMVVFNSKQAFEAGSDDFNDVEGFREAISEGLSAWDVADDKNTYPADENGKPVWDRKKGDLSALNSAQPGDLIVLNLRDGEPNRPSHIQVVTKVSENKVNIHQGNFRHGTTWYGAAKYTSGNPYHTDTYKGSEIQRGSYQKANGTYKREGNAPSPKLFPKKNGQVRRWRFFRWNRLNTKANDK